MKYYRVLFEELLKANITPVVTLYHWDLPTTLMDLGGWTNPKMVDYFENYARVAFTLFGDLVKIWTTMNELHQHCYNVSFTLYYYIISYINIRIILFMYLYKGSKKLTPRPMGREIYYL